MSAISTDPVDVNWRLFQDPEKPLTTRGRSRLCGNRRTRGHEVLEKHDGSPKHSGRRFVALAKVTMGDLMDGVSEFFETRNEAEASPISTGLVPLATDTSTSAGWEIFLRNCDARDYEKWRRAEDTVEAETVDPMVFLKQRVELLRRRLAEPSSPACEVDITLRLFDLELQKQLNAA